VTPLIFNILNYFRWLSRIPLGSIFRSGAHLESGQRRVDVIEFLELADILGFDAVEALSAVAHAK
jgi:hypothetical protein